MFNQDEFMKYATRHLGMSRMHLEKYADQTSVSVPNIQGFTPNVIEERQMNVAALDVFSRLMMDRIIFLGLPELQPINNKKNNEYISFILFNFSKFL